MSSMELNKGKLTPVTESIEACAERLVDKVPEYYDSKVEYLQDNSEEFGIVILNSKLYTVDFELEGDTEAGFSFVDQHPDGTIDFFTYHYNGGAHWTEVIEDAINNT